MDRPLLDLPGKSWDRDPAQEHWGKPLDMAFLRDTAFSAAASIATVGGRLLTTVLLTHTLPQASYGQFVYLQWVIEISTLVCAFGLPGVMTRFLPQLSAAADLFQARLLRWLAWATAGALILTVAAFTAYVQFDREFGDLNILLLALWCLSATGLAFLSAALQGLFRYDASTVGNIAFAAVSLALILAWRTELTVSTAALAMTMGYAAGIISAGLMLVLRKNNDKAADETLAPAPRSILVYAGSIWITALISSLVWSRGEFAILRIETTAAEIALYSAALTLTGAITQAANLLTGALMPHLARRWAQGAHDELRAILNGTAMATLASTSLMAIGLIGLGDYVIGPLFSAKYLAAYPVLCLLAIAATAISSGAANAVLQIETDGTFAVKSNILGLVVLFGLSFAFTPLMGIMGTAIARACSQAAVGIYSMYRLRDMTTLKADSTRQLRAFLAALSVLLAFYALVRIMPDAVLLRIVLAGMFAPLALYAIQRAMGISIWEFLRLRGAT
ncbi:MAG: oligosaccharide flippase family protein [Alphaproteobacteria bacterium]|nr:oligosaccharide flippase family protein [Alphaproteobacteria bacterium]